MATSTNFEIKNKPNLKTGRLSALLAFIFLSSYSLFSQSYLIPVNAPLNQYPITFTDAAQQQLVLNFLKNVTPGANISRVGWSLSGTAATITRIDAIGTSAVLTLSTAITYAERLNVKVTYNAATGNFLMQDGTEPLTLTNIGAVNNAYPTQADFSNGLYGENPPVDICAAVLNVSVTSNLVISSRYRNSIYFTTPRMNTLWMYPALVPKTDPNYVETGGVGTGIFSETNTYAAYPDNTTNCTWIISFFPYVPPVAPAPGLSVTDRQVFITIPNYKKDNGTPVPGTGDLGLDPPVDDPRTLFCVGENITNFIFTDATVFDCQLPVEPNLPNTQPRNVQFVYGTQTGAGIPNVFINVNGTPVQVTDNNGVSISGIWHVNPDGSANVPGYSTPSGFFEGPVVQYLWDSGTKLRITPMIQTYPISHTGDYINDADGDIFDVTLRNWGPCNSYNALDPFTSLQAVTEFSRLRLVLSPPLPTAPDVTVCFGASTTLSAVRNGTNPGVLHWYNNADLSAIHEVGTGPTYNPGALAAGVYNYWVREIGTSGQLCEGPSEQVVLTINPTPNKPTVAITGSLTFCFDGGATFVTLTANPNAPPAISTYQWYKNGAVLAGAVTNAITLNDPSQNGIYTVRTFGINPTNCPGPLSDPLTVTIYGISNINSPIPRTICELGSTTFTISSSDAISQYSWEMSTDGITWTNVNNGLYYDKSDQQALQVLNVPLSFNGNLYRGQLKTVAGGCWFKSNPALLTVNPLPTANAGAVTAAICQGGTTAALGGSFGGSATAAIWSDGGAGGSFANNGGTTPGTTTYTASAASGTPVTLTLTTSGGSCGIATASKSLTVNPKPTVNAGGVMAAICQSGTSAALGGSFGGGATSAVWSDGGAGGSFTNNGGLTPNTTTYTAGAASGSPVTLTLTTGGGSCGTTSASKSITVNLKPTVNVGAAVAAICQSGTSAALGGTFGGGATSAVWSDGGAGGSFTNNGGLTPNTTTYTAGAASGSPVTLTLTTGGGSCGTTSASKSITVNLKPTVNAGAAVAAICQSGTSVALGGSFGGGATSAIWSDGGAGGSFTNNGGLTPNTTTYTAGAASGSPVTLTLTTSGGSCGTATASKSLTVNPKPTVNAGGAMTAICQSGTSAALGGSFGGGATSAVWSDGGAGGSFTNNGGLTPNTTTYKAGAASGSPVTLTLTTGGGSCGTTSASKSITVNLKPLVNAGAAVAAICQGGTTAALGGSFGGGATAATWSDGGAGGSFTNNGGLTPNTTTYTAGAASGTPVTLTLTTSGGLCGAATATKSLTVNKNPTVNAGVAIAAVCQGGTTAALGGSFGGGATAAVWSDGGAGGSFANNGGTTPGTATYTASAASATPVTLTLTTSGGLCGTATASKLLIVNPIPLVNAGPDQSICALASATLAGTIGGGATSATWSGGGGLYVPDNTTLNAVYTPTAAERTAGSVILTLTTNDPLGPCTSISDNLTITIGAPLTAAILTGSGDACFGSGSTMKSIISGGAPPYTLVIAGYSGSPVGGYYSGTDMNLGALAVGAHNYTLTSVTDACPNTFNPGFLYTININGIPDISSTVNNTSIICNDASLNFTLNSTVNNTIFDYTVLSVPAAGYSWTAGKNPVAGTITDINGDGTETLIRQLQHNYTSPVTVTYTITPKGPGATACPGTPITRTVIVEPTPVISSPNKKICDNASTAITVSTSTTTSNTTYYTWTVSAVGANITGASNGPANGTALGTAIAQSLHNSGATFQTVTYNITPWTGTAPGNLLCSGTPINVVVTVEPTPVIASANKIICNNTSTGIIVSTSTTSSNTTYYTWTVSSIGSNITGASDGPATGTLRTVPISQTLINSGSTSQTVTYNITPWIGTAPGTLICTGLPITVVVTVEPTLVISSPDKTICNGTSTALAISTGNTTGNPMYYTWTVSGVGANISGASSGGANGTALATALSQTLTNSGATAQTVTYNITPRTGTAPASLLCSGTPIAVVVTVEPTLVITSPNKTICNGASTALAISTGNTTGNPMYYTWTVSGVGANISGASSGGANGTALATALSQTLSNSGATAQTVTYNITPRTGTAPGALLCSGTPIAVVVTVEPTLVITSPGKTICNGASTALAISTGNTTGNPMYYTWTVIAVGANISGASSGGANGTALATVLSQTLTNSGATAQTVTYNITPRTGTAPGALLCSGTPIAVVVTVEPALVITSPNKTICNGASTALTISTGNTTGNPMYYTWTVSGVGANISGASSGGANGTALATALSQTLTNSGATAQTVTYDITPWTGTAPGTLLCSGTAIHVVVTVEPTLVITSPDKTICNGASTALAISTGNTTGNPMYYTWTVSGVGANISGASSGGANGTALATALSQTLSNSGATAQTVTYNITPRTGTAPGALLCSGTPIAVVVTVEPTLVITSPGKTICNGASTALAISTGNTTGNPMYYTWTVSGVGANISGASSGGANGTALATVLSQTLTNSGATAQTVTYNITPRTGTAPGALLCSGTPIAVVVTVEPALVITSPNKTICNGASTALTISTGNTTGNPMYYTWTVSGVGANISGASSGGANGTALATALSQTLTNSGLSAQTVTYDITPWTGTAPGTLLCSGTAIHVVVTVEPTLVITSPDKTICNGASTALAISTGNTTGNPMYYTWTVSGVGANISGASSGGANGTALATSLSQTLTNSGATAQTVTYNITPRTGTAPGALLCSGTPISVVITVEPTLVITSPNKTICNGTSTALAISTGNTTNNPMYYTWTVSGVGANISGASSGGANGTALATALSQTLTNSGATAQTVTYNITPRTGTAPGALLCSGTPIAVVVTVEPTLVITSPDKTICNGTSTALAISTGNTAGNPMYYTWTVSGVGANISGASSGGANGTALATALSQTLTNSGATAQTVTYNITPRTGTAPGALLCSGAPIAVVVTVEPTPVATIVNSAAVLCSGGNANISITSPSTTTNPLLFDYTVSSTNPGATGGTAYTPGSNVTFPLTINGTLTNSSLVPLTVTYTATPKAGLCSGMPVPTSVTVNPVPVIAPNSQTICSNSIPTITVAANIPGTTFTWSVTAITGTVTGTALGNTGTGFSFTETLRNVGTTNGTVTYRFTPTAPAGVGGCVGSPFDIVITVKPEPVGTNAVVTICSGNTLSYSLQGNINGNNSISSVFSYTVSSSDPVGVPPASDRVAPTGLPITDSYTNTTGNIVTILYTITPISNPGGCTGSNFTYTVTLGSEPVLDNLNKFACNNAAIGLMLQQAAGSVAPSGYNILSKTVDAGLTDVGNAVVPSVLPVAADYLSNDKYTNSTTGNLTVTYNVQPILAPSCIGAPKDIVITVYPPIVPGSLIGNTSVCYNTDAPVISNGVLASGGDGAITYSWYYSEDLSATPGDATWVPIAGANLSSYDPGVLITPTKFVRKAKDGSCAAEVYTNMITIGINPLPVTSVISGPALLCNNAANQIYRVDDHSGSTYAWNITPSGAGAILNKSFDGNIYFILASASGLTGVSTIRVTETITATGCVGAPVSKNVNVTSAALGVVPTGPTDVCEGATGVIFSVPDHPPLSTYSWSLPPGAFITSNPSLNQIEVSFPIPGSGNVTAVETNGACTTFHLNLPVTIHALPVLNSTLIPPAICSGSTFNYTPSSATGGASYAWTRAAIAGITEATTNGTGSVSEILTNTTITPIDVTYVYITSANGCDGPPRNVVVTVNPSGQVNLPADQVVCDGTYSMPVTFTTNNIGGTTTYTWVNSFPGIGLPASGTGNIPFFTAINPGTTPVSATVTVTPHFKNGLVTCDGPAKSFTFTINPSGQVNDPSDQVVCNGAAVAPVAFGTISTGGTTTYTWTNTAPGIGLPASGNADIATFTAINNGTTPVVATVTVTPHFDNGSLTCSGPAQSFTITVNPTGQVNVPANQLVCNGSSTAAVVFSTANLGGTTTYSWTNSDAGIGLAAFGSGNIAPFTAINPGTSPLVATVTVTPHFTNGSVTCDGPPESFTITINPSGQVVPPASQVVCNGSPTATVSFTTNNTVGVTTYSWTNTASGIGLAASGTGDIASFNAINTGTSPVVATITVTPHFKYGILTCDGPVQNFTVTVNPTAQVNSPADKVACDGAAVAAVNFTTNNTVGVTTYTWTNTDPGIGLAVSGNGNLPAFTADNPGTSPVTATIEVTPHFANGSVTCDGPAKTFTISVNPTAQVNDPADQVACDGTNTATVIFATANTGGTTTYSWSNDNTAIGLGAGGSGNIPFFAAINAGTAPEIANITVTPHFTNGSVTCNGPTQSFTITVNPAGQVNDPADQVVCNGSMTAAVNFTTNNTVGTTAYTWTNTATGIGLLASGSGDIAPFAATNTGTTPVVATITVTPHFTNGLVTCDGPAQSFTITVNPAAQVNSQPDRVVCNGSLTGAINFSTTNTGGTTTYTWVNTTPGMGLPASGLGNIASFTAINAGTLPVVATVTVTPHFANGSVACDGPDDIFTITVNPTAQVNAPANQVVCNGAPVTAVAFTTANTGGITTYTWTNSAPGIGLAANGSGDIASFTASNITTMPVVATITVTPHFDNGSVTCNGTAQTFTITVNPAAQVNTPASQVVCNNSSTATVNFTTNNTGGVTTYSWTNTEPGIGLGASGTGNIPVFTAINAGTSPIVASIQVTPHFDNGSVICDGPSKTFTIIINPGGQVNAPVSQVLCNGSSTTTVILSTVNTGGTTTYTWTNDQTGIGLGASGSGNISAFSATNPGTSPLVATITVTPHFANGSVSCDGPGETFTITVNPSAQVDDPVNQVVCDGSLTAPVNFATNNTGGVTNYTWTNSAPGIGLVASGSGDIAAFNAINAGTSPVVATITVTPQFANGVTCSGASQSFTITVNPQGQVNIPASQVVCNGASTAAITFTTINSAGTTTYSWTNSAPGIGLPVSGSGNIAPFIAGNPGTAPVVATISVTPHYTNGGVTCDGTPVDFTITVNPTAQTNAVTNQVVCNGTPVAPVTFTTVNTVGTTTFTWTNSAPGIGLPASGTGDIATFNAINTGNSPATATVTVTPHFENDLVSCSGPSKVFTITVNPTAQVNTPANKTICNGALSTIVNFSTINIGGVTTYSWVNSDPGIGLAISGNGNIASFTATNAGSSPITATITVTPHFTNALVTCDGPDQTFTITVNPSGQVDDLTSQEVCTGELTAPVTFTTVNTGGTTTYSWTNSATGIGLAATGTGDIPAFTASNITSSPIVATITVTPHFENGLVTCNGPVKTFTISVSPAAQVNIPANQVVCAGLPTADVLFSTLITGGATTYSWTNTETGIGLPALGTGNILSFIATNTVTSPLVGTISVTPHFTNGTAACDGPAQTFTITVNPAGQVDIPANQVACNGSSTATVLFTTANTGGSTTYTWTNDNTSIGLGASGSGSIPFFTAINSGTAPVVSTVTVTPHFSNGSVTCNGIPESFTITVNPSGQVNDPANQVVCNGTLTAPVIFSTNNTVGVTTYTWTNTATGIGLAASGTGDIAAFTADNPGSFPVVATVTVTPHFDNGSVICNGPAQTFSITVNPTAQANVPAGQVVCNGSLTSAVNFSTNNTGGATTYTWINSAPGIGLAAVGSGNIASFPATNPGTLPVMATITVTPHFANGSVTCDGPSQTLTITVNPTAQVDNLTSQVLCNGDATTPVTFTSSNTGGITTYSWTNSASGIGLAATGTSDIPSFTAVNFGIGPIVATITVTPHFDNGSVTCSGPAKTFTITVNPAAQVNDPADRVVCGSSPVSVNFTTSNVGGLTTYTWNNTETGIGLAASGTGNIASFNALNPGTAPLTAIITVTPHFDNASVVCDGPDQTFTITVNPAGQVDIPASQVVCNGAYTAPLTFTTSNSGGTTTYTWTNDLTSIGLGATGSGSISAFAAINLSSVPVTANITVTPHFANGVVSCDGTPQTFSITVNPAGQVNVPVDQVVCNGFPTTAVNFTTNNTGGATTYTWTNTAPGIGLVASGSGDIAAFNAINPGASPVVATITVTPNFDNGSVICSSPSKSFTITVNPTGQVNTPLNQLVCNGSSANAINFTTSNTGGGTTYTWSNTAPGIGLAASGTGNIAPFTALNAGTTPAVATVVVTPHYSNGSVTCDGTQQSFTITVNPTPTVSTVSPTTICSTATTNIALTSNVAGANFSWTIGPVTGSISGASASNGSTIAQILVNSGTSPGTVTYVVTPTANSCSGTPVNIVVTVNPTPDLSVLGPTTICSGTATNLLLSSNVGGTTFGWIVGPITGTINGASASNGVNISQTLINTGTSAGTVTYIVTPTSNGCPGNPVNIVVTVNPTPNVSTVSPTTICSSATTNIALTSNVPGTTFSWTIGAITGSVGGATSSNGSTISQTLFNPGLAPGTVTYIVTPTANSCSGTPVNIIVTVNPLTGPTIFTGGAIEVCQDASDVTYTATSTNSSSIVYSVSPLSAGVIDPANGVMNWDAAFSGMATITATSSGLCGTTAGTLSVRVKGLPAITLSPVDRTICEFGIVDFDVTATGSDLMYQWYVDDNSGSGFIPVTGGSYTGEASPTLQIWSADRSMNGYKYYVTVSGCLPDVTSAVAVLTVNTGPELTLHPSDAVVCLGDNAVMAADATGTSVVWQWYVNKGSGFVELTDDANFNGAATKTLTITNALSSFNNWLFRAKATGVCGAPVFTNFGRLSVTNPPKAVLQPVAKAVCENSDISFLGNGSGYNSLQWQVSTNGGTTWTNITDNVNYIGSLTNQLSLLSVPAAFNNNQYRLGLVGSCITVFTNSATLTVNPNPVVHFAAAVNACGGVPLVLNGNPGGGTAPYTQHRWTGDVGPLNNYVIQSPTFNSVISGSYNLNYKVTDSKGCSANDNLVVNVDSPSADFTQDVNTGCTPATVTFSKDMTGITKFWWEFDDGSPKDSVNASPVHIFSNANSTSIVYYNVKLTVQSPGGCFASITSTVTVYPAISASFTATPGIVCSGSPINFISQLGASKYFWDFGDGVSGYFSNTTNHMYTNTTTAPVIHTVKLTTTSFYNCTDVKTFDITVMPMPLPQFTALPVTQIYNIAGNPVTFTNTTNPGTWSWLWRLGDGSLSTDQNPVHTYTSLGTFDVVLKVSNANCSDSVKHTVSVTPVPPVAKFDQIPSGCSPLTIEPNNTSLYTDTPGTTYMWDFGDGGASTSKNPSYIYFTPGIYRVELIVTGPGGTSNYSQVVNAYPSPKANFQVSPTIVFVNDENIRCFNLSQGADSYLWEFGDGDTSKVQQPYHKYMEEGTYDITLWAYLHNVVNGETITCSDKYVLSPGVTVEPAGVIRFSTVFTPNKDGEIEMDHLPTGGPEIDQFFFPPIREKVINYKLQVFNRLGVLIFESHDINIPWNGYYQHKLCQQGVYVWYVEGKYANGMPFKKVGDVTLLH